jgi:hypothetical protein
MKLDRREFMQSALIAGVAAGAGSMLNACGGIRHPDVSQTCHADKIVPLLDATRREILHYAALAPSGHNSQPWRIRVESADEWVIEADPRRRLPAVDPDNRELMLSLGAFTENLVQAAGALGYAARIQVLAQSCFERDVIRVNLRSDALQPYLLERLARRRTVRSGYRPDQIRIADVEALRAQAGGRLFYFPNSSQHADCLRDGTVECFRIQSQRDAAQREFVAWLRLSDAEAMKHRDGLTTEGMELQGFKGWFIRRFVTPDDFMKASFRQKGIDQTARLAGQGGGWLVITSSGRTPADLIEAGRRFERMALMACERRIGLHPMTQILEEKQGLDMLATYHDPSLIPQFVIRIGYLDRYPQPVSLRRPVQCFVA